jgi:hypothetical protein
MQKMVVNNHRFGDLLDEKAEKYERAIPGSR